MQLSGKSVPPTENELRALVRAGYRGLVCFPHLGEGTSTVIRDL